MFPRQVGPESAFWVVGSFQNYPLPHFGSVLNRLDALNRKTEFKDFPAHLQPYREFLIETLPQLHAVKDSWRNKSVHVDGKIVPIDVFTEEMALGVYSATLLLMQKLSKGLPEVNRT
jgi:hypothetical protein